MKNSILRPFRSKLVRLAAAGVLAFGAAGCGDDIDERGDLWFNENIGKLRITYWNDPDRLETHRQNGALVEVIIDDDGSNEIGDDNDDRYIQYLSDGRQRTYTKDFFIDETGIKFEKGDDVIADAMVTRSRNVLKKITGYYQSRKTKITEILESRYSTIK